MDVLFYFLVMWSNLDQKGMADFRFFPLYIDSTDSRSRSNSYSPMSSSISRWTWVSVFSLAGHKGKYRSDSNRAKFSDKFSWGPTLSHRVISEAGWGKIEPLNVSTKWESQEPIASPCDPNLEVQILIREKPRSLYRIFLLISIQNLDLHLDLFRIFGVLFKNADCFVDSKHWTSFVTRASATHLLKRRNQFRKNLLLPMNWVPFLLKVCGVLTCFFLANNTGNQQILKIYFDVSVTGTHTHTHT